MQGKRACQRQENQENVLQQSQPLTPKGCVSGKKTIRGSAKQSGSSTLKPIKIVANEECAEVKSRLSFQKNDSSEYHFPERQSRAMQYGISGLDLANFASQSRLASSVEPPNVGEILRMTERFAEQVGASSEDEHSLFRVRAMHRLVELLTRIMEAPAGNEDMMVIGGVEHQDSLNLLIDRYEYVLEEQEREMTYLKQRLHAKEEELLNCQRRIMTLVEHSEEMGLRMNIKAPFEFSGLSSLASPQPTKKSLNLEGVSEVKSNNSQMNILRHCGSSNGLCTQPFIKVCDGYRCQENTAKIMEKQDIQFVVELKKEGNCLFERNADDSSPKEQSTCEAPVDNQTAHFRKTSELYQQCPSTFQLQPTTSPLLFDSAKMSLVTAFAEGVVWQVNSSLQFCREKIREIAETGMLVEAGCQTDEILSAITSSDIYTQSQELIPHLQQAVDPTPILQHLEYISSATNTVQNSRNVANSLQQLPLSDRDWAQPQQNYQTSRINPNPPTLKRIAETVLSVSISHTTVQKDPHRGIRHFKQMVKCMSSLVNSNWKLITQARKKAKTALPRTTLKVTQGKIESFERWFNDKYDFVISKNFKQPPELFYSDSVEKVREFVEDIGEMTNKVCDGLA